MIYTGDGGNDYCPVSSLRKTDIAFVRQGYSLEKGLNKEDQKKLKTLQCQVFFYKNAEVIWETLANL